MVEHVLMSTTHCSKTWLLFQRTFSLSTRLIIPKKTVRYAPRVFPPFPYEDKIFTWKNPMDETSLIISSPRRAAEMSSRVAGKNVKFQKRSSKQTLRQHKTLEFYNYVGHLVKHNIPPLNLHVSPLILYLIKKKVSKQASAIILNFFGLVLMWDRCFFNYFPREASW